MRAYFFGNMYLSSIQQGVQAAHVVHELFIKYPEENLLYQWAEDHKTMILLNGGFAENLRNLVTLFESVHNPYPWSFFEEEQAALEGAITSVGIVIPEKIYQTVSLIRQGETSFTKLRDTGLYRFNGDTPDQDTIWTYTNFDVKLIETITNCGLAR